MYICKKRSEHASDLYEDYITLLYDVIAPIIKNISVCYIEDEITMKRKVFNITDFQKNI